LPYHRTEYFEELARSRHFHLKEKLLVRQTPRHGAFRGILLFSRNKESFTPVTELVIKDELGGYTKEFTELLKDYYLYL
jgi:tRNA1Val (adenine37-N6)-methyltransferase